MSGGVPTAPHPPLAGRSRGSARPSSPAPSSPARAAREPEPVPAPLLRPGAEFDGTVVLPGAARIDGGIRGEVIAGGPLWVGETGFVEADLEGEVVVIAGTVRGDVRARDRLELRAGARVEGSIRAPRLILAEGSVVNGPCACGLPEPPDSDRGDA